MESNDAKTVICPLLPGRNMISQGPDDFSMLAAECRHDRCAWWTGDDCAIPGLVASLAAAFDSPAPSPVGGPSSVSSMAEPSAVIRTDLEEAVGRVRRILVRLEKEHDEWKKRALESAALRARLFPNATLEQTFIVTCPKCDRKLVTRWIDTGPVGGVDVASCPCGNEVLSESEGNAERLSDVLAGWTIDEELRSAAEDLDGLWNEDPESSLVSRESLVAALRNAIRAIHRREPLGSEEKK